MLEIKKSELIEAYTLNIGAAAAKELIEGKIGEANLEDKESYTRVETARICGELMREKSLIKIVAQNMLAQLEQRELDALGGLVRERTAELTDANRKLKEARDRLEIRVQERTAELSARNEELERQKEHFRALFNTMVDPVVIVNGAGVLVEVTDRLKEFTGFTREELLGKNFLETRVVTEESKAVLLENLVKRMKGLDVAPYEVELLTKDGRKLHHEVNGTSIVYMGKPADMVVFRDITRRKNAEESLRESEMRFRTLYNSSVDAIVTSTPGGEFLSGNAATIRMFGCKNEEEFISKTPVDLSPEYQPDGTQSSAEAQQNLKTAMENGSHFFEWRHKRMNGEEFFASVLLTRMDVYGKKFLQATVRDITREKRSEEAVRASEERYRTLAEGSGNPVFSVAKDGTFLFMNREAADQFGGKARDFVGRTMWNLFSDDVADQQMSNIARVIESGESWRYEEKLVPDGDVRWYETGIHPLRNSTGTVVSVLIVSTDITERKAAEEELRLTSGLLQSIMDSATEEIIVATNPTGKILSWNEGAKRLLGYGADEVVRKENVRMFHTEEYLKSGKMNSDIVNMVVTREPLIENTTYITRDGRTFPVQQILTPRFGDDGGFMGVLYMARDITEQRKVRDALRNSEARFRTLVEKNPIGAIIVDRVRRIRDVNDAAQVMIGRPKAEIVGRICHEFVCPQARDDCPIYDRRETVDRRETALISKDRGEVAIEKTVTEIGINGETMLLEMFSDITDRKSAEEHIVHLNSVLHAIRYVSQLIVHEKDRDRLLQGICDNLIKSRGYYNTWIALMDKSGGLITTAEAGLGKDFSPMVDLLERGELTVCGEGALAQQGVVVTRDPASTCTDCPLAEKYMGRGAMTVRLAHDGRIYGMLSVSIPTSFIADEEQVLFEEIAGEIGFALHGMELEVGAEGDAERAG